jgi:hypothetical protein
LLAGPDWPGLEIQPVALLLQLEPLPMRRLFGAVAAHRHAAPSARMTSGMIGEQQRACRSLARFDVGEIFLADEFRQRFPDRQQ